MTFVYPQFLLAIVFAVPLIWLAARRRYSVGHTQVSLHMRVSGSSWLARLTMFTLCCTWISACIALARPQVTEFAEMQMVQTRDFIIQADVSGSMSAVLPNSNGRTRIVAARDAVIDFVRQRDGDRVALLLFSDETFYSWPLSRDLAVVERRAMQMGRYVSGGTNFDTESGAFFGAFSHFREMSQARTRVLILVTDGEASIHTQRSQAIINQLRELNVRLYVLGVGDSWVANSRLTHDLRHVVETAGGTLISIGNEDEMRAAFSTIGELEKSFIDIERSVTHRDVYWAFALAALFCALLYLTCCALTLENP